MSEPALALIEFNSIAVGIHAGDAMAKRAPITYIKTGTVQPGKYLVLIGGEVGDVEESLKAGLEAGAESVVDRVFLPRVHWSVLAAVGGARQTPHVQALGIIETRTVAGVIMAADAGVKGAKVLLMEIRLADGLGGKGLCFFAGEVEDVQAAIAIGTGALPEKSELVSSVVIPALHREMETNILKSTRFGMRARGESSW